MEFTTIYRYGKPERFFIKLGYIEEFAFLQPYFLITSSDKTRFKNILEMDCLFSGSVWQGRQRHGYGYSCSADVYDSLILAAKKAFGNKLSQETIDFFNNMNTHDCSQYFPPELLKELSALTKEKLHGGEK